MKIEAAVLQEDRTFAIEWVELDDPQPDEVLVRIVAAGMCHTDLAAKSGQLPYPTPAILGHEGAGIVMETGARVTHLKRGDHVLLTFASCRACERCLANEPNACTEFIRYNVVGCRPDGSCTHLRHGQPLAGSFFYQSSFATHALAHFSNVVKVPDDLPLDVIAPLGCGIQTGAGAVLNILRPSASSSIAIFGTGAVGLAALMAAKISGCDRIVAVDRHASRLELARSLGASDTIQASQGNLLEQLRDIAGGDYQFVIDTTGVPAVMSPAIQSLGRHGTAVLLGGSPHGAMFEIPARALSGGRTIRSSIEGDAIPEKFLPKLIDFYRRGALPLERIITRYRLEDIQQAVHDSESGVTIKPVLCMPNLPF